MVGRMASAQKQLWNGTCRCGFLILGVVAAILNGAQPPQRVCNPLPSVSHSAADFSAQTFTVRSLEAVARKEPEGAMLTCVTYLGKEGRKEREQ